MAFYLRKSVSAGPFRFNFSKGGAGLSVGVKGLRIGTGPRGHYIHAGRGGLYYRSSIGRAGAAPHRRNNFNQPVHDLTHHTIDDVNMVEIESGDVLAMQDSKQIDLLNDINSRNAQTALAPLAVWGTLGITAIAFSTGSGLALWSLALGIIAWLIARSVDSYRRRSVMYYELEEDALEAYNSFIKAFDELSACQGKWHIASKGQVNSLTSWKRNSGAHQLVDKKPTDLTFALPKVIACNLTPPRIAAGLQNLYFFPDIVLVEHGHKMGAIGYSDLWMNSAITRFIEDGVVPRDASVIDHTWKHSNKNGGPDRRFANNFQIPICVYENIHFTSRSGLNECLQFSRCGVGDPINSAIFKLAELHK